MTQSQTKKYLRGPVLKVDVKRRTIEEAVRGNSGHCMIAEAIKETVAWAEFVSVDLQTIRMTDRAKGVRYTYLTPRSCQQLLIDFDQGINPDPFSFKLAAAHVSRARTGEGKRVSALPKKATLIPAEKGAKGQPPVRVGGRPPPKAPSSNQRREFGLRAFRPDPSRAGGSMK